MGSIADTVKEASIGQKVIKVYSGQEQEQENFTAANQYNRMQSIRRARISAAVVPVTVLALAPATALILYIYLNYLRTGPESAGQFMSYFAACMMLTSPLKKLAKVNEKLVELRALEREADLAPAATANAQGALALRRLGMLKAA